MFKGIAGEALFAFIETSDKLRLPVRMRTPVMPEGGG